MPGEQASQLAATDAEALGKLFDRRSLLVERALLDNQPYRALDGCAASDPGIGKWRGLRAAPQTRPKSRRFGRRCGRKKLNVSRPCWANRADRSTIDASGPDPGEKPAIIAAIPRDARALAFCKSSDITPSPYHSAAASQRAIRGWSPIPASNVPALSLSLSEKVHLGWTRYEDY